MKSWRAAGLVEEANEFAEAGEWDEVRRTAMASMQNEESLEALRLVTQAAVKTGDSRSLEMAYSLFRYPGSTPEDRSWVLSLAFDAGDLINATQLASLLSPEDISDPAVHYQLVRGYLLSGKYQAAITLADDPTLKSRSPKIDLLLADHLAGSDLEGAREETTARLKVLLNSEDRDLALRAMNLLAFLKDHWIHEPLAQVALDRFQDDPDLSVRAKLNLEFFRIGLNKRTVSEAVAQAIADYRESDLLELVTWMARLEQHQQVVDLTEDGKIRANPNFFKWRVRALENLEQWAKLQAELEAPNVVLPKPLLRSTQALVALQLGDEIRSIGRWQDAVDAAKVDPKRNWFYQLAETARQLGNTDQEMESMISGIKHPLGIPPDSKLLASLFQWMNDRGDGERLYEISAILLRREPGNPLLLNNYSYLKALYTGVDTKEIEVMEEVVSRFPEQENFQITLAFLFLSVGDPKACLERLDETVSSPAELSNTGKAIYAKALYELQMKEEAIELTKSIDWDQISSDEQEKLALPAF